MKYKVKDEQALMEHIFSLRNDMEAFVLFNFPWGEKGTPLEDEYPEDWQIRLMRDASKHAQQNYQRLLNKEPLDIFQKAVSSGHGIGKSAFFAWFIMWILSTRPGSAVMITANNENQLKTKTWATLGEWHARSLIEHWFDKAALSLKPTKWLVGAVKGSLGVDESKWGAWALTWDEKNPAGFAGAHNDITFAYLFDEASEIPYQIWEAASGAFTDARSDRYWMVFGNPTENTGAFYDACNLERDIWDPWQIDSRTVKRTDKKYLDSIIVKYGEDSDRARIRVKGQFPRQGIHQFINMESVELATQRDVPHDPGAPLVMGVDIARYGEDKTVIRFRRGRDGRSIPPVKLSGKSTTQISETVGELIDQYDPDGVCIDGGGVGGGVVDELRRDGYRVHEVLSQERAEDPEEYWNKRAEMWDRLKDWVETGCIDDDPGLRADLRNPQYELRRNKLLIEPKDKMRDRGVKSTDDADALALTLARSFPRRDRRLSRRAAQRQVAHGVEYDMFG